MYLHNAIHFSIFNVFLSSGTMLVIRTILHMKLIPETPFLKMDKVIAYTCLIFCILDFLELIYTATHYSRKTKEEEERKVIDNQLNARRCCLLKLANQLPSPNESAD